MRVWIDLKYVTKRASGLYYYRRRIPDDLRIHYDNKEFYVQSLKTKVLSKAEGASLKKTQQLDILWSYFRNPHDKSIPRTLRDRATALLSEFGLKPGEGGKVLDKIDEGHYFTAIDLLDEVLSSKLDGVRHEGKLETEETALISEAFTQLNSGKEWYWEDAITLHHRMNG